MPKSSPTVFNVRIADRESLKSLFSDLKDKYGSDQRAGDRLGISRDTFRNHRVGGGRVKSGMKYDNFASIVAALGGDPHDFGPGGRPSPFQVESEGGTVPATEDALESYQFYERFIDCVVVDETLYVWSHYQQWMERELRRIRPRAEPVIRELWDDGTYQRQFRDFLDDVGRPWKKELPPATDLRCWLAIYRAVEPLADTKDTWGIERSWQDMHEAGELKDYLELALESEALLLKPPADLERIKRAQPPQTHFEALGEIEAREQFFRKNPSATTKDWNALVEEEEGGH